MIWGAKFLLQKPKSVIKQPYILAAEDEQQIIQCNMPCKAQFNMQY